MLKATSKWWLISLNFWVSNIRYVFLWKIWKQYEELSGFYHPTILWLRTNQGPAHRPWSQEVPSGVIKHGLPENRPFMHHIPSELNFHLVRGKLPLLWANRRVGRHPIGSMYAIYVTFTTNISQMFAYIPYMDPMAIEMSGHQTRGVRCLELLHDFTWHGTAPKLAERLPPVVSGGEDGGVKLWPLVEVERKRCLVEVEQWFSFFLSLGWGLKNGDRWWISLISPCFFGGCGGVESWKLDNTYIYIYISFIWLFIHIRFIFIFIYTGWAPPIISWCINHYNPHQL